LSQKTHLTLDPSLGKMPHPWASLPLMGVLPNLIYAREALFAYVNSPERDMKKLRAIRLIDRSIGEPPCVRRCRRTEGRKR
jgi:hypothetical protein